MRKTSAIIWAALATGVAATETSTDVTVTFTPEEVKVLCAAVQNRSGIIVDNQELCEVSLDGGKTWKLLGALLLAGTALGTGAILRIRKRKEGIAKKPDQPIRRDLVPDPGTSVANVGASSYFYYDEERKSLVSVDADTGKITLLASESHGESESSKEDDIRHERLIDSPTGLEWKDHANTFPNGFEFAELDASKPEEIDAEKYHEVTLPDTSSKSPRVPSAREPVKKITRKPSVLEHPTVPGFKNRVRNMPLKSESLPVASVRIDTGNDNRIPSVIRKRGNHAESELVKSEKSEEIRSARKDLNQSIKKRAWSIWAELSIPVQEWLENLQSLGASVESIPVKTENKPEENQ